MRTSFLRHPLAAAAAIICVVTAFSSCKPSIKERIVRNWQEVNVINPEMDDEIYKAELFMDTVGDHTDSAQNRMLYGEANKDSVVARMKRNIEDFGKGQDASIRSTSFDFHKDGTLFIHYGKNTDSCRWHIDQNEATLIVDFAQPKNGSSTRHYYIAEASDTLLKLNFANNNIHSTAVFRPKH